MPVGEDRSFAKKSVVAKKNRYKDKFPCTVYRCNEMQLQVAILIIRISIIVISNYSSCYIYSIYACGNQSKMIMYK